MLHKQTTRFEACAELGCNLSKSNVLIVRENSRWQSISLRVSHSREYSIVQTLSPCNKQKKAGIVADVRTATQFAKM